VNFLVSEGGGRKNYKQIKVSAVLTVGTVRFVTVISGENGTSIYLNGAMAEYFPHIRLIAEEDNLFGWSIQVGNPLQAHAPWYGDLFGLALYGRQLRDDEENRGRT